MALPLAAGSTALRFLRTLYKAKKKVGKGASRAAEYAGKKGFPKTSQFITGASQKIHKGTRLAQRKIKAHPKTSAAIGGAVGWDLIDRD